MAEEEQTDDVATVFFIDGNTHLSMTDAKPKVIDHVKLSL